jgi:hypothetical protein
MLLTKNDGPLDFLIITKIANMWSPKHQASKAFELHDNKTQVARCNYPLIKHLGMWKCTITRLEVAIGKYSICPTNSHVKNEKLFTARYLDTVATQLVNGGQGKEEKKIHPICGNLASSQIKSSHDRFWTDWKGFSSFWRWRIAPTNVGLIPPARPW